MIGKELIMDLITLDASALDNLTTAFSFMTTQMSAMVKVVLSEPIFLLPVAIYCAGAAIGLCGRLIGR